MVLRSRGLQVVFFAKPLFPYLAAGFEYGKVRRWVLRTDKKVMATKKDIQKNDRKEQGQD